MRLGNKRQLWLLTALCALGSGIAVVLASTLTDQWIEVPRDGYSDARVVRLLQKHHIDYELEQHFGVTYVRVRNSSWPEVCRMLDQDSVDFEYPLNIKRRTMLGQVRDIVRNPPF